MVVNEYLEVMRCLHLGGAKYAFYKIEDMYRPLIEKGIREYPLKEGLVSVVESMEILKQRFDECYDVMLPQQSVNPVPFEQQAWKLLSPQIELYIQGFKEYLEKYDHAAVFNYGLTEQINQGWKLYEQWRIISDSYQAKALNQPWYIVREHEETVKVLIKELSPKPSSS